MRRFMVDNSSIENDQVAINGDEAKHISTVLRLNSGDMIEVFDGSGIDRLVELVHVTSSLVIGRVVQQYGSTAEPPFSLVLVQGLAKGEKMDLIIQKAVEIGANRIIPVNTDHTVVKIDPRKAADKVVRWNRISYEACKQSGRSRPPLVDNITDISDVFQSRTGKPGIFFYEGSKNNNLRSILRSLHDIVRQHELYIFIGPEGGFSKTEAKMADDMGMTVAGLGPRILRTETAALAALAAVMYEIGDLGGCE